MKQIKADKDVIIVGGGLAGLTLTCLLAQDGVRAICIDRTAPDFLPTADLRTTAISYGSHEILSKAGIWQYLEQEASPINSIKVLDGQSPVLLDFEHDKAGNKPFGWVVDNAALRKAMHKRLSALKKAKFIAPCSLGSFEVDEGSVKAVTDEYEFNAKLLVGADGRRSWVRDQMGVPVRHKDYKQRAIICAIAHENPHNGVAIEHFHAAGPFAVLPMTDDQNIHRSAVVITEENEENSVDSLAKIDKKAFEALLRARLPESYGAVSCISERISYPLSLSYAIEYIGERTALIADAAHGIHPIAGQGLNLGFRDIEVLAELIISAKNSKEDIGSQALLQTYQRRRRPDNMAMIAFTDGINALFSNKTRSISILRKAGLRALSRMDFIRDSLLKKTMGTQ